MRRAKVVCTLGPASEDRETIRGLVEAGMSVARLNASHGSTEGRAALVDRVRSVADEAGSPVATMVDVPGPEVRTASLPEPIELDTGSRLRLVEGDIAGEGTLGVSTSLSGVAPGDSVLFDDGRIETTVEGVEDEVAVVTVDSFGADLPVVAKIERADAVENLAEILEAADGVMVARGDLGVECPLERVPLVQKRIIRRAGEAGIPVITATEMLDSMVHERRPTRAEASDVANAVLDGTDAVMLSGETAVGDHPVRVVETMTRIVRDVEASEEYAESRERRVPAAGDSRTDALARSARYLARDVEATAVVAVTESGYTARKVAKYRPSVPVVAVTPDDGVRRRLALTWGVLPRHQPFVDDGAAELVERSATATVDAGVAESGDTVVVLAGMMTELEGANTTNTLKVHLAAEVLTSGRGVSGGRRAGPTFHAPEGDLADCPEGAVVVLPEPFDAEFTGDLSSVAAIVAADRGMTSLPAVVARELGVPMVGDAALGVPEDTVVTVDGDRGVVYESDIVGR